LPIDLVAKPGLAAIAAVTVGWIAARPGLVTRKSQHAAAGVEAVRSDPAHLIVTWQ
jgi:hypothetical protein